MNTIKKQRQISKAFILFTICLLAFSFNVLAYEDLWDSYEEPSSRQKERLLDDADLLSESEELDLLSRLNEVSLRHSCNVAILTVDDHTGPIQDFSDDYFVYNGFLTDFNENGILLTLSMADREYAFTTGGAAIYAFTDYGQDYLIDKMSSDLSNDDYYHAFLTYVSECDSLLEMYENGTPYDVGYKESKSASDVAGLAFGSILGGLAIALLPILKMKSDLKTVKMATDASNYQEGQGIRLRLKEDRFVRKTLHKTPIPKDNGGSRGGHGGGSTTHSHSSGHSLGGSHGHF